MRQLVGPHRRWGGWSPGEGGGRVLSLGPEESQGLLLLRLSSTPPPH